jgi:DNA-binding NarL/FixJ family response regulator
MHPETQAQLSSTGSPPPPDLPGSASSRSDADVRTLTRVLIVEDEALVAMDIEDALGGFGFDVVGIVDSEAEAIEATIRLQADVVLMDITLREGDGISATRALMARSNATIIFVSANSDPATLEAAMALKPAAFIRKPFVAHELPRLVADALSGRITPR